MLARRLDRKLGSHLVDRFDYGNGLFFVEKRSLTAPNIIVKESGKTIQGTTWLDHWSGPLYPDVDSYNAARIYTTTGRPKWVPFESPAAVPMVDLMKYGATAISRVMPGKPSADLATALGELREGLPKVVGASLFKHRGFSSLGDEYLNYQFGIAPTISDVKSILSASSRAEKALERLIPYTNRDVRRRIVVSSDDKSEMTETAGRYPCYGGIPTSYTTSSGTLRTTTTTSRRIWYSGTFRQREIPAQGPLLESLKSFNRTYGAAPSVLMAWNLVPYSWLVDWFANAGDVFKNFSYLGMDGWYQRYGYVMAETTMTITKTWSGRIALSVNGPLTPVSTEVTTTYHVKQRLRASPYAFGWNFDGLSDFQKTILAALGMTRTRRS